jgi:hypothetical protein
MYIYYQYMSTEYYFRYYIHCYAPDPKLHPGPGELTCCCGGVCTAEGLGVRNSGAATPRLASLHCCIVDRRERTR